MTSAAENQDAELFQLIVRTSSVPELASTGFSFNASIGPFWATMGPLTRRLLVIRICEVSAPLVAAFLQAIPDVNSSLVEIKGYAVLAKGPEAPTFWAEVLKLWDIAKTASTPA